MLAAIGLYGLMTATVSQRSRELMIAMASLTACVLSAWRAMRIDPIQALRG